MSFKDSFMNMIVEKVVEETDKIVESPPVDIITPTQPIITMEPSKGETDEKIKAIFIEILKDAKTAIYGYPNFEELDDSLTNLDEKNRIETGLTVANSMNSTPNNILQDAIRCMGLLNEQKVNFEDTMKTRYNEKVTVKEKEIEQYEIDEKNKLEQIVKLNTEITLIQENKKKLRDLIIDEKGKIEKTANNFSSTLKIFLDKIAQNMERIKKYAGIQEGGVK